MQRRQHWRDYRGKRLQYVEHTRRQQRERNARRRERLIAKMGAPPPVSPCPQAYIASVQRRRPGLQRWTRGQWKSPCFQPHTVRHRSVAKRRRDRPYRQLSPSPPRLLTNQTRCRKSASVLGFSRNPPFAQIANGERVKSQKRQKLGLRAGDAFRTRARSRASRGVSGEMQKGQRASGPGILVVLRRPHDTLCTGSHCLDTVLQLRPPFGRHTPDGLRGVT